MTNLFKRRSGNEEGSVMVIVVLIMVALTTIGISVMNTTTIEIQIAGNEKFHKMAFQNADSGIYTLPKVISACVEGGSEDITAAPMGILARSGTTWSSMGTAFGSDGTLYREIMGYDAYDTDTDARMVIDDNPVEVDVRRVRTETLAGGGAEFASGAEGLGSGSTGSSAIIFEEDSFGEGPSNSFSNIGAFYRKVLDMPGGL